MIPVFLDQAEIFFSPHVYEYSVGHRLLYHQPWPCAFVANADAVYIRCLYPEFIIGSSMSTGYVYISGFHYLIKAVCQLQVVRGQCKRRVIASPQPVRFVVEVQ